MDNSNQLPDEVNGWMVSSPRVKKPDKVVKKPGIVECAWCEEKFQQATYRTRFCRGGHGSLFSKHGKSKKEVLALRLAKKIEKEAEQIKRREPQRDRILFLANLGLSLRDIAFVLKDSSKDSGRETIRRILKREGFGPEQMKLAKWRNRESHLEDVVLKRIASLGPEKPCFVCGKPVTVARMLNKGKRVRSCSTKCAKAWESLRYRTTEGFESHRISMAKMILNNPDKYKKSLVEFASKIMANDAPPANRKYFVVGSNSQKYAKRYGWSPNGKKKVSRKKFDALPES